LEEWIPGQTLGQSPKRSQLEEAGALLGGLHARSSLGTRALHERRPTSGHRAVAVQALRRVRAAGRLSPGQAVFLAREMRRLDPGAAPHGLVHWTSVARTWWWTRSGACAWWTTNG
jgi:hypothetical protein